MLSIDIIENKRIITNPNTGQQLLDLVPAAWNPSKVRFSLRSIAIVSDDTEMRADLLALLYMKSISSLGTLLKINNISNPLSLQLGEILAIPTEKTVRDLNNTGIEMGKTDIQTKSFRKELQDKISKISQDRVDYLNSKNISNVANEALPPNILQDGEQQILVGEGKLIFGPDIGQCRSKNKRTTSLTELKSKLAQKRIFE